MAAAAKKAPSPVDVYVGHRVRAARMEKGMSQEKLGDALQLTFQQVQKYEKGANRIGSSRLQQIALAVGKPVAWFFAGAPGEANNTTPARDLAAELLSAPGGAELAEHYLRIPNNAGRRAVVDVARLLTVPPSAPLRAVG